MIAHLSPPLPAVLLQWCLGCRRCCLYLVPSDLWHHLPRSGSSLFYCQSTAFLPAVCFHPQEPKTLRSWEEDAGTVQRWYGVTGADFVASKATKAIFLSMIDSMCASAMWSRYNNCIQTEGNCMLCPAHYGAGHPEALMYNHHSNCTCNLECCHLVPLLTVSPRHISAWQPMR